MCHTVAGRISRHPGPVSALVSRLGGLDRLPILCGGHLESRGKAGTHRIDKALGQGTAIATKHIVNSAWWWPVQPTVCSALQSSQPPSTCSNTESSHVQGTCLRGSQGLIAKPCGCVGFSIPPSPLLQLTQRMRRNAGQALWKLNLEGFKNGEEEKTQKQQSKSTEDTRVLGMLRDG